MILETGLIILGGYMWHIMNTTDKRELIDNFNKAMEGIGLYSKTQETFKIYGLKEKSYGWRGYISIPKGLSLEHLNSKLNILEDNLNGIIEIDKDRFKKHINFYMVNKDVDKFKYEPVKCKPYELYIGKDFKLNNFKLNVRKDPMILIGGVTGTGKSFLLASILTNLIYNSSRYIEIYLLQIQKSEISAFDECEGVKSAYYTPGDCILCLENIMKIIEERSNSFKEKSIRNISQWNMHYKKEYMKEIYVVIEELSFFLELDILQSIAKVGRSVGVHLIGCIQRTVATQMDTTLKSQMTRITFHQKSVIDSNNIINTSDAKKLKERECIIDGNNDYITLKTPWIDEDYILLHKYVASIKIPTKDADKPKILNVEKIDYPINIIKEIEEHSIIDVSEEDMKEELGKHRCESKFKTGVISLEEFKNANRKR